jgi:hypothetical protein
MKPNTQDLDSLRVQLALQAIADREGVDLSEIEARAMNDQAEFVRTWIEKHYFDLGGF